MFSHSELWCGSYLPVRSHMPSCIMVPLLVCWRVNTDDITYCGSIQCHSYIWTLSSKFIQVESSTTRCDHLCPSGAIPSGGCWWSSAGRWNLQKGRASQRSVRDCGPWQLLLQRCNNRNKWCPVQQLSPATWEVSWLAGFCTWNKIKMR
jgi:hypothetical protein